MAHPFTLARLLANNEEWAKNMTSKHPDFFKNLAGRDQKPKVLWLGCADSRVPESVITNSLPGDIFVTRNIANQLLPDDDSAQAVLAYAVSEHVRVEHIIVVGHTNCGGVEAAMTAAEGEHRCEAEEDEPRATTPLDRFIAPLVALAREHKGANLTELVELNVRAQVDAVARSTVVERACAQRNLQVHGWVYELETGRLRDLGCSVGKEGQM